MKSLKTIKMQPQKMSPKIEAILCMDVAGMSGMDMAAELGLGKDRISVIRNSPLYIARLAEMQEAVKSKYLEKRSDKLASGDPVEAALKDAAITAANKKIELMRNSSSEFVASAAAGDILDRAGYKAHQEKTKVTVEVTEKMANRWERALQYESGNNVGGAKIRFTQESSS